ncbi:lipoate--protein ligase [Clostridium sediminicola]|uniref:lipoate--protein ligase n=1 Tax=Clostridium sediminicola TaxID=3114879 RepID=UPI0031F2607F
MLNNNIKQKIIISQSKNPWENLALEELLLESVKKNEVIMYLWQNDNTIVIGRNQNPWKECKCDLFNSNGGKIARRLSGGGAVYHDLGNINFTFLMDKELYHLEKQLNVILSAVKALGINAKFTGRNDITVDDKKFSGNAFYFTSNSAYHHGTILVNSDLSQLVKYLQVSNEKIKSKGIDSVKSRVTNLKNINGSITNKKVIEALKESFQIEYGECYVDNVFIQNNKDEIKSLYNKYSSWEWIFGETPKFDITYDKRFAWGGIEINLSLKNGKIVDNKIFSDAMNSELILNISKELEGLTFNIELIAKNIVNMDVENDVDKNILKDIHSWLLNQQ